MRKGFSEVGYNRALKDGLLEKGVPSIQGDVRKGTKGDRKQQQQWQGLILYTGSLNTIQQSPRSVPAGPQALRGGCEYDSGLAPTCRDGHLARRMG